MRCEGDKNQDYSQLLFLKKKKDLILLKRWLK